MRLRGQKRLSLFAACVAAGSGYTDTAIAKAPHADTLEIDITASIAERCGVSAVGARTNEGGRIDLATRFAFNFRLDCNTPFRIGVAAQNGALQLHSTGNERYDSAGFATKKDYTVGLSFMTDQDGLVDAGICNSQNLSADEPTCDFYGARPGSGFNAGRHTTAIGRDGSLTVRWTGEAEEPIRHAAGAYQETITIVVGPRT